MTEASAQARLTPQFCFSTVALRDFLRLSRSTVDDSITQSLNALVTPAKAGFDPRSTASRAPHGPRQPIGAAACEDFKGKVLFPSWQSRSDVLTYCSLVATSPDPDDPEIALRASETEKNRDRIVDERLDPYSARFFPREARTEQLANLMRQERGVEKIVRSRTWAVLGERCGTSPIDAEQALDTWRREQQKSSPQRELGT
ncbi:caffeine-induced death protein 2 [Microdochium trichocladiopsis]|uniref:Caffeine-induced death protein 2 n=1 Tax=Microdochium trichocladiopsis TaxID=1682393 RepID=A0A9P9BVK5_9PEZI|nr:caffeine-induced death protein 2 [Microdochium trichocladiopsis]KAH7039660.1 caffeine-induced death protein 2 [Microdochium trichocladiopsis]